MNSKKAELLIKKYITGNCTPDEESLVENWYNQYVNEQIIPSEEIDLQALESKIYKNLPKARKKGALNFRYAVAAAIILFALSFIIYFVPQNAKVDNSQLALQTHQKIEITPGGNKADLTLANGEVVDLDSAKSGIVILNDALTYDDGTMIQDNVNERAVQGSFNTISTPMGGQYQVVLPDGTKVWLNSSSSLKYNTQFNDIERRVELVGEAYFEVEKDTAKPFKVISNKQEVSVLGTQFNVSAYPDEKEIKTTLIEGSVKISYNNQERTIVPGEQSIINKKGGNIEIVNVDVAFVKAWKEGYFAFDRLSVEEMMNQISRWYDVQVIFEGKSPRKQLTGQISKYESLSTIINILKFNGLNIDFKANSIIVKE